MRTRPRTARRRARSWRLAPALAASLVLHGAAVAVVLSPATGSQRASDVAVVELVDAGNPLALPSDIAGVGLHERATGYPPALGAAASPPAPTVDDRVAALVAERDELSARLDAEAAIHSRLGDQVAALTAESLALTAALGEERKRAEKLEQSLAAHRADGEAAIREMQRTYDALLAALRDEISEQDVSLRRAREGLSVSIVDRVLFPSGQARLTPEGDEVIEKVARVLTATAARRIVIEGHTDNVPIGPELRTRFPSNWELSTARATEVVRRLVERGLPPDALEALGRADTRAVASNDTEAGRSRNRRIEIILPGSTERPFDSPQPDA